jgi:septum formation protein
MAELGQEFRLVLASASPRRRELLAQAGYAFEVQAAEVDESLRAGETPAAYVRRLAGEKAGAVLKRLFHPTVAKEAGEDGTPRRLLVLGADTTVVCEDEILAKPADAEDARLMLRRLSGRVHHVLTGVAVATESGMDSGVETTAVTFSAIPQHELEAYCATSEPFDKAGAYGIQGYAARWIPRIDGCYFNVVGLPIARVVKLIELQRRRESNRSPDAGIPSL